MKHFMNEMEKRRILSEVALGNIPPDTVITNGYLFNTWTGEFIKGQSIWIKDGMIAYVGPDQGSPKDNKMNVIDANGMVLLPGLIEGHTHVFSNRYGIEEYIRHVIPSGVTTTVITETIELATVVGKESIEYVLKSLEGQPIRFYYTVPPMCGLTLFEEKNVPTNEELLILLKNSKCVGVGEVFWSNMLLEGSQGERLKELASLSLSLGKKVERHTAGATGKKLQAFTTLGASSCHEPITEEEVLERLRLGYWVMIREGSIRKELDGVIGIFKRKIDFRRLILATDGVDPEGFLEEGYLDASVRRALKFGIPPELTYQMVTINVAEHFHLDHLIGSLSPGKMADLLIIPSPDEFSPQLVMCDGKIIFRDGKSMVEPKKVFFPDYMFHTVNPVRNYRGALNPDGIILKCNPAVEHRGITSNGVKVDTNTFPPLPNKGKARVMELVSRLVTRESIIDLENPEESRDVIMVLALDRSGSGKAFMGLLKGFGLQRGAYGSTMIWDMEDMVIVGCDTRSMETVIGRLKENGGGGVYAIGNEIIAEFPAPLCGVLSLKPMETLRKEIRQLEESLGKNGVKWEKPLLTIDTFGSAAIPYIRITHNGYVRVRDREILSLEV